MTCPRSRGSYGKATPSDPKSRSPSHMCHRGVSYQPLPSAVPVGLWSQQETQPVCLSGSGRDDGCLVTASARPSHRPVSRGSQGREALPGRQSAAGGSGSEGPAAGVGAGGAGLQPPRGRRGPVFPVRPPVPPCGERRREPASCCDPHRPPPPFPGPEVYL